MLILTTKELVFLCIGLVLAALGTLGQLGFIVYYYLFGGL